MKKILILESIHNEGIEKLKKYFDVQILLNISGAELFESIKNAAAIVVKSRTQVNKKLIDSGRHLEVIGRAGTGTDNIDIEYAKSREIKVLTVPTGNTRSAAEFSVMQILSVCKNSYQAVGAIHKKDFRRDNFQGLELSYQTVGLIGLGNVGFIVAQLLKPFGCRIIAYDTRPDINDRCQKLNIEKANSLEYLIQTSDVISLHVKLTEKTKNMIGRKELSSMKKGVRIVNCARGNVMDEKALLEAVNSGHASAVCIDVLTEEPSYVLSPEKQTYDNPLLHHPNITVTPHLAASTFEAQKNISLQLAEDIISVLNHEK